MLQEAATHPATDMSHSSSNMKFYDIEKRNDMRYASSAFTIFSLGHRGRIAVLAIDVNNNISYCYKYRVRSR